MSSNRFNNEIMGRRRRSWLTNSSAAAVHISLLQLSHFCVAEDDCIHIKRHILLHVIKECFFALIINTLNSEMMNKFIRD